MNQKSTCGLRAPRRPTIAHALALALLLPGVASFAIPASPKSSTFPIEEATIASLHEAMLAGKLTSVELVRHYLARIKAYNGPGVAEPDGILGVIETVPHSGTINALSTLNLRPATLQAMGFPAKMARSLNDAEDNDPAMPDALEVAAALDQQLAETGRLSGPLHGIVFAIKDQYDTFDLRTTSGATVPYANDRPPRDATFVRRLREAGAIILAKSQMGEYASGIPRSSFGGTFNNPYDTERSPMGSSSGSASAVAANLVTCAIGEETGTSIRGPACYNNLVGIAATQELVSRDGMIGAGINTRCGPICRTVEDAARVLDVIAGYDPEDWMTAYSVDRMPSAPYQSFARARSLEGMRIGVLREYMNRDLFTVEDQQNIELIERAIEDLRELGATIVDPGPTGELFTPFIRRDFVLLYNAGVARDLPELFPATESGEPANDRTATLVDLTMDPSLVPEKFNIRDLGRNRAEGESKYMLNLYLRKRGDRFIRTISDLIEHGTFFDDARFGDRKRSLVQQDKAVDLDTTQRLQRRYAVQHIVLHAMAELGLDAIVYPTNNIPAPKLGSPNVPRENGRPLVWSFLGAQGFPTMTVPAGFTSEVYDRVIDPDAPPVPSTSYNAAPDETEPASKLVGPVPAALPVGLDVLVRPFAEPTMLTIASAYEHATRHRKPPPDFGALPEDS